jgi:hypothetical protein
MNEIIEALQQDLAKYIDQLQQFWRECDGNEECFHKRIAEQWQPDDPRSLLITNKLNVMRGVDLKKSRKNKKPNNPTNKDGGGV